MENLSERLLGAWLTISSVVNNERIVSRMPFNEAHVCNLLYRQRLTAPDASLTATELCARTRMLKSQMNKVLSSLEQRQLIERFPAATDRRKVCIRLVEATLPEFERVHAATLALVDHVISRIGVQEAEATARLLPRLADCVDEFLSTQGD